MKDDEMIISLRKKLEKGGRGAGGFPWAGLKKKLMRGWL